MACHFAHVIIHFSISFPQAGWHLGLLPVRKIILIAWDIYGAPKSREILMFVRLQKDAKQCCDVTDLDCAYCYGHCPETLARSSLVKSQHCFLTNIKTS